MLRQSARYLNIGRYPIKMCIEFPADSCSQRSSAENEDLPCSPIMWLRGLTPWNAEILTVDYTPCKSYLGWGVRSHPGGQARQPD